MNLIPIIIMGALSFFGLGASLAKHGEKNKAKINFWVSLISSIIWWGLLYLAFFI